MAQNHWGMLVKVAATTSHEDALYPIFTDFAFQHKKDNPGRFCIYPQTRFPWNGQTASNRTLISDFALGNFTAEDEPRFKVKRPIRTLMAPLPDPQQILDDATFLHELHVAYFQGESQAKAVYKNDLALSKEGIWWILLIGPYWTPVRFGPFTEAELTVRIGDHRKPDDDADFAASQEAIAAYTSNFNPPKELYLLGTLDSHQRLEEIISSTDNVARDYTYTGTSDIILS